MKQLKLVVSCLILISIACTLGVPSDDIATVTQKPPSRDDSPCGDNVCEGPENPQNCPQDCAQGLGADENSGALYLGIMVHLEGWKDGEDQAKFEQHSKLVREYADLFEKYGAKLTWESKEVTEGVINWGDNVLLEMEGRGHGIGVHADIGGQKTYNCGRFVDDLRKEKEQLESLSVYVRHVSGVVSHCDWVSATVKAGYQFTTGQVAYSVMSMPVEDRPAEYRNCQSPSACHDTFPTDLADRMHPWRMDSGENWLTHDPNGKLVMLASSGGLTCMEEEALGIKPCGEFSQADLDYFFEELERAISLSQLDQVNIYYLSWSIGSPLDEQLLETWLQGIVPYLDSGQVEWKTLPEMYDAYVQWESNQ